MQTDNYRTNTITSSSAAYFCTDSLTGDGIKGLISEVTYSEDQPWITQLVLLPLLQQLGQQSRWQLWLTPQQKLSRQWVKASGLSLTKVMQISQLDPLFTVDTMVKALHTGNYSVVIGWLTEEITDEQHARLSTAAEMGNAIGFIMKPIRRNGSGSRPRTGLKIHSYFYH